MDKEKTPVIPGITGYLSDSQFYAIWKYANSDSLIPKRVCNFEDVAGLETSRGFAIMSMFFLLRNIGINKLEGLVFHTDIYKKYAGKSYEKLLQIIKEKPDARAIQNLTKVLGGKISELNTEELSDILIVSQTYGLSEFFEYDKPKGLTKKKLDDFISEYLKIFIEDGLLKDRQNYYNFQKQKEDLLFELKMQYRKYGSSFIFYHPSFDFISIPPESLPIHTVAALEHLGLLEVEGIWIFDMELPPEKQTEQYRIKIKLKPQLINIFNPSNPLDEEITFSKATRTNSQQEKTKPLLTSEGKNGFLKFYKQGPKIPVGNTGKRKYKLLECLIDPLGTAKMVDEVFNGIKLARDDKNAALKDPYLANSKKLDVIQYTIKELQKIKGLKGKISLGIGLNRKSVWLRLDS